MSVISKRWVQPLKYTDNSLVQIICFPFAGSGIAHYRSWVNHIPDNVSLSAILLPGREVRISENNESDINNVCLNIIDELKERFYRKRLVFFGHSMGSLIAYEVARRLEKEYQWFIHKLIVSGRGAPHRCFGGAVHRSSDVDLIDELERLGATEISLFEDEEMRRIILNSLRADYHLLETYRLDEGYEKLSCPVITCTGRQDTEVTPEQMLSWNELSRVDGINKVFPGGHFYLSDGDTKESLLKFIARLL